MYHMMSIEHFCLFLFLLVLCLSSVARLADAGLPDWDEQSHALCVAGGMINSYIIYIRGQSRVHLWLVYVGNPGCAALIGVGARCSGPTPIKSGPVGFTARCFSTRVDVIGAFAKVCSCRFYWRRL